MIPFGFLDAAFGNGAGDCWSRGPLCGALDESAQSRIAHAGGMAVGDGLFEVRIFGDFIPVDLGVASQGSADDARHLILEGLEA